MQIGRYSRRKRILQVSLSMIRELMTNLASEIVRGQTVSNLIIQRVHLDLRLCDSLLISYSLLSSLALFSKEPVVCK